MPAQEDIDHNNNLTQQIKLLHPGYTYCLDVPPILRATCIIKQMYGYTGIF